MWGLRSGFSSKIRRKVREELLRASFYGDIGNFQGIFLLARYAKLVGLFHLQENVEYRTPNDEVKCRDLGFGKALLKNTMISNHPP